MLFHSVNYNSVVVMKFVMVVVALAGVVILLGLVGMQLVVEAVEASKKETEENVNALII